MYQATSRLLSKEELDQATKTVQESSLGVFRTPTVLAKSSTEEGPVKYVALCSKLGESGSHLI